MSLEKFFENPEAEKFIAGTNLIDFSQIVISTIMHTYDEGDTIDTNLVRHIVLNTIRHNVLKNKKEYPNIVICVDNAEGGYWRRKLSYFYKKHREGRREDSGWDWDGIFDGMKTVAAELKENLPYKVLNLPNTEADDCIGVLCHYISTNYPNTPIMITSSDGDFTQLQKFPNVKQWSPMHKKWVKPKHGGPRRDLLVKIVKGDAKDTIANIKMKNDFIITKLDGEKQKPISSKLMAEVFEADDPKTLFTGDELTRYNENELMLDLSLVPEHIKQPIITEYETQKPAPRSKIYPYFVRNALVKLLDCASEF